MEVALYLSRKSPSSALLEGRKVIEVEASGFARSLAASNLKALAQACRACARCRREMKADRPAVAVAFGGYASVPGALAALSLGIPLLLQEQNAVPGLANRLLAPAASAIAVAFQRTLQGRRGWERKAVVTGNPLLRPPRPHARAEALRAFGLREDRRTLAVVGGSQGAVSLNRAVLGALPLWEGRQDIQVVHAVGRDKYAAFMAAAGERELTPFVYRPLEFVERMDLLYAAADLMVCRAGAATVSELAAAACPSILVPYPHATAAHQDANAEVLAAAGAALVLKDGELDGRRLVAEADALLGDEGRLRGMREAAGGLGSPDAAARLAELALSLA